MTKVGQWPQVKNFIQSRPSKYGRFCRVRTKGNRTGIIHK
jgi:hypothetical protein